MTYGIGRMPRAPEVDVFEIEIGGDERFVSARQAQHRAIITNADAHAEVPTRPRGIYFVITEPPNARDKFYFGKGQRNTCRDRNQTRTNI